MFGRHGSVLKSKSSFKLGARTQKRRPFGGISKIVIRRPYEERFRGAVHPPSIKYITTRLPPNVGGLPPNVGGFDSLPTWSKLGMSYTEWKAKGNPAYVKK